MKIKIPVSKIDWNITHTLWFNSATKRFIYDSISICYEIGFDGLEHAISVEEENEKSGNES